MGERSLLRDTDSPIVPQASTGRTTRQSHNVNYALLSYISDVHEPVDTSEEALSHPLWSEVLVAEMSSIEDNGTERILWWHTLVLWRILWWFPLYLLP